MARADYAGPVSDILTGGATIGAGAASSKLAWSRTKRMMQKRVQWHVSDLRKAGLNPILAAGGAAPSMGSVQQQKIPDLKTGDTITTARQNLALRKLLSNQTKRVVTQMGVDKATQENLGARTELTNRQADLIGPASNVGSAVKRGMDKMSEGIREGRTRRDRSRGANANLKRLLRKKAAEAEAERARIRRNSRR